MTNSNVAANNTTANTTLDNTPANTTNTTLDNTMNDYAFPCIDALLDTEHNVNPYDANTVMIGEDLADVYQLSATEYVVRGTTCENVRQYVHQVVGDNYAGATTVAQRNSEDVFVTLVTDAHDLPWNAAPLNLEQDTLNTETTMNYDDINDMMNTNMEAMQLKPVDVKTEQQAAEAIVPMLFGAIAQRADYVTHSVTQQQLAAATIFRTLFNMNGEYDEQGMCDNFAYDLVELNKRNRDKCQLDVVVCGVETCVEMGFIERTAGGMYIQAAKFINLCSIKYATAPQTTPVDDLARNTTMVKGGLAKAYPMLEQSIKFQQATAYTVDLTMVRIVEAAKKACKQLPIWKGIRNSMAGVAQMVAGTGYYSEIYADKRGRTYFASHFGANPQGCDYNRSVYSLMEVKDVQKDSPAYEMFMLELAEAAGKNKTYMSHNVLMRAAYNPVVALTKMLENNLVASPFTYIRLAIDYACFAEHGACTVSVPMGLDAKCSGTQILAILAGNMQLLQATGFSETKVADPYMLCAKMYGANADRNIMKKPYMVVQYGGGAASLEKDENLDAMWARQGIDAKTGSKAVITAVKAVLGRKIVSMQEAIAGAVLTRLKDTGATSLEYKHLDGQLVKYVVCGKVDITGEYTEIRYTQSTVIGFGSKENNTGLNVSDGIPNAMEFVRTFMVNYVQGIDAMIARTVAVMAKDAGLNGYVSIHDCFRTELADAPLLMNVIRDAYNHLFVKHDPLAHLAKQIGFDTVGLDRILTAEMVYQENAYFFCQ